MSLIALTGASGFLGSALISKLGAIGGKGCVFTRKQINLPAEFRSFIIPSIDKDTNYREGLHQVECVIHCAARVHVMNDESSDPLADFREVNTLGTLNLARQAAESGVKRFIFVSSIKVSGEGTQLDHPYKSLDKPNPVDPYGISKYEAEEGLKELAQEAGMEVVIIRPTLVYGPGVKANFLNMMKWLNKGVPLPLGAIHNKRSLVALDNLVDLIVTCIDHPKAGNETFLVSDDRDVSTTELLKLLGNALDKQPLLLPVPMSSINFFARLVGKSDFSHRLCGSLQVDISHTKETLGWKPPYSVEQSLLKTANAYKQSIN